MTQWLSDMPRPRGRHCPWNPVWSHETHVPSQGVLQQNPSAQLPDPQSSSALHGRPLGNFPHELPLHCMPGAQSASEAHDSTQLPFAHPYGQQTWAGPSLQEPLPSQMWPPDTVSWSQVPGPQVAPGTYSRQAPFPSQVPS